MIKIEAIPAFSDNYIWCLFDENTAMAAVVDPGDASAVLTALAQKKLTLAAIVITHHHADHTGGIDALLAEHQVPVFGPHSQHIPQITHPVTDSDQITILGVPFQVLSIPGHTLDHIAFYCDAVFTNPVLFCGDTLFGAGCGRIFEGDPIMMHRSLAKITSLPANTLFYCAHEYTLANLAFAQAVEPDNPQIKKRIVTDTQRREQGLATVPSTLDIERQTNPFLRCEQPDVIKAASRHMPGQSTNATQVFTAIRDWKDHF